ncbi:MAG: ubiquitin-conjugating enzyme family protein, partial [Candidatus Hodarchaeota archaeon]
QLEEEFFNDRLAEESRMLRQDEPSFSPVRGNLRHWVGIIMGRDLYEEAAFPLEIIITRSYPFRPPRAFFLTFVYHPNISATPSVAKIGNTRYSRYQICVGTLGKDWVASSSLVDVVESIRILLTLPNPLDPLNKEAAKLLRRDPERYTTKALNSVKQSTWTRAAQICKTLE